MSCLVLAALVLGIGVNSAMFSVVNAVLLRPVPLYEPERLVFVTAKSPQSSGMLVSYPEYKDWKAQSGSFQTLGAALPLSLNVTENGPPEHLRGIAVTAYFLKTLGLTPAMGRDFTAEDEKPRAARVAVLGHEIWQRRFGGDRAILGRRIKLNDEAYSIVGVLPHNPFFWVQDWDVWVGMGPFLDQHMMSRETRYQLVLGRLADSINAGQAQTEMEMIAARLAAQYPASNKNLGVSVVSLVGAMAAIGKPLWPIVLATGLILVLACVNVVTVFVASAIERRKELSVRLALGAARSVIWRQLLVQGLVFAVAGALLGLAVAKAGLACLMRQFPNAVPRFQETTVDQRVFWFTICLAVGCTLVSSILPGIYSARLNISNELKGDLNSKSGSRFRFVGESALIVLEVGLAAGLSLVSGLLIKSFYELEKVDLGFNPHGVLSFQVSLPAARYDDEAKVHFYEQATQNLRAVAGVESTSGSLTVPAVTNTHFINLQVDSQSPLAGQRPFVDSSAVLPGFFATMKMPLLQGRDFTEADRAGSSPVAIVDSVLAARMWPGQSALGKRLRLADVSDSGPPWREVVGVVGQVNYFGPESKVQRLQVYEPAYQHPPGRICFVLETAGSPASLRAPVQKAINDLAPDLPLDRFQTVDEYLDRMQSGRKVSLLLLSGFAAVGVVLGMIGIYGVVANSVLRRRREIAIRMALGASRKNSMTLVIRVGLLASLAGVAVGAMLVVSLTHVFSAFLFGVRALDAGIYLLSGVGIMLLALAASLLPATGVLWLNLRDVLRE